MEDLVPKLLPLASVQRVLQNLLRERVSIRDAVSILEALGEAAVSTRNPVLLTEYVRQTLRRSVVKPYVNHLGELPAWFLDPSIEQAVEAAVEHGEQNSHIAIAPQTGRDIVNRVSSRVASPEAAGSGDYHHRSTLFPAPDDRGVGAQSLLPGAQRGSAGNARADAGDHCMRHGLKKIPRSDDQWRGAPP